MSATLSIMGLWNYDNTIFNNISIPPELDKQTLVNNLLMECAELEIIYPDPGFMKFALATWSETMLPQWIKLYESTQYEYNPIHNYDRHEEYTDSSEHHNTDIGSKQGYNETGFVDADKLQTDGSGELNHEAHIYGNIGVTTTMQMIKEQRDIVQFNVYQKIIDDFKQRFCLLVY